MPVLSMELLKGASRMTAAGLPPIEPASRRHRVADVLRQAITAGRFKPGDRLIELELAKSLGTSRAPVREALRQLEQEGLVVSYPYRGTEVVGVSQEEVEEVLVPIRLTIERFAFRRALPLLEDGDFDALRGIVAEMRRAEDEGDADALADADIRFHELVIARADQPHCLQIWRTLQPRVRAYFRRDAPRHAGSHPVSEQHEELLAALLSREESRVLATVDDHVHLHLSAGADEEPDAPAGADEERNTPTGADGEPG